VTFATIRHPPASVRGRPSERRIEHADPRDCRSRQQRPDREHLFGPQQRGAAAGIEAQQRDRVRSVHARAFQRHQRDEFAVAQGNTDD